MPQNRVFKATTALQVQESQSLYVPRGKGSRRQSKRQQASQNRRQGEGGQPLNHHSWSLKENVLYKQFLIENAALFQLSLREKKRIRINVLLSEFIQTRDPSQCRSHHQKMLKYHGDIPKIIAHVQKLENELQPSGENSKNLKVLEVQLPQTPSLELREIDSLNGACFSLWQSLLFANPDLGL